MSHEEITKLSPLRVFESSIHGGLGRGKVGMIAAKRGIGKTALMVHLAIDKLLRGCHVIHVSFAKDTRYTTEWYDDIFNEILKTRGIARDEEAYEEMVHNRVIMNFTNPQATPGKVLESIKLMIEQGHFKADAIIFEGLATDQVKKENLPAVRKFAEEMNVEVWYSVSSLVQDTFGDFGLPTSLEIKPEDVDVCLSMMYANNAVQLTVLNDHGNLEAHGDLQVKLDPETMLITK